MRWTVLAALLACGVATACSGEGHVAKAAHPSRAPVSASAPAGPAALPRVPEGFRAASATFVSAKVGWVLGAVPCAAGNQDCGLVARTTDAGATWEPMARVTAGPRSVLRFADARNGFLLDDGLLATHDGGRTWRAVDTRRDAIEEPWSAEAAGGLLWLTGRLDQAGRGLWLGSVRRGSFDLAPVVLPDGGDDVWLSLHGRGVALAYLDAGVPRLLVSHDGDRFARSQLPCAPSGPLALRSTREMVLACGTAVRTTRDAGRTWHELAPAPAAGAPLVTQRSLFMAADRGVYVSRDQGRAWTRALGVEVHAAGFESAQLGFVVDDRGDLWLSDDDGREWDRVDFRRTRQP